MPKNKTNNDGHFKTDSLKKDLKGSTTRGGLVTLLAQGIKFSLTMATTMILARLLTPEDYGLIAMVSVFVIFAGLFKDVGLSMATVQYEEITHEQVSSLFWINVGIGALLMAMMAVFSPLIALFYHEPKLILITIAVSSSFFFSGLTIQHQALLRRQMRFTQLAIAECTAIFLGLTLAVIVAATTKSFWALVINEIVFALMVCVMVWKFSGWRPSKPAISGDIKGMLKFGGNLTGFNFVNYFARNADNILIGHLRGADALGIYNKAYNLLLLPIMQINYPISSVAVPTLSRLQNEPEKYANYYYRAINIIGYLTIPLMAFMIVAAEEIIMVLLGEQWRPMIKVFTILGIAGLGQSIGNTTGWVYTSLAQTDRMFRWGIFSTPVLVLAFIIGIRWGIVGVATAYACAVYSLTIPMFWYAFKESPIEYGKFVKSLLRPLFLASSIAVAILLFKSYHSSTEYVLNLIYCMIIGAAVTILMTLTMKGMKKEISDCYNLVREAVSSRGKK